ncbi:hypothetical protein ACOMHN_002691 [Nucella lapillus]
MESHVIAILPKPDSENKAVGSFHTAATYLGEAADQHGSMEIQNVSVGEVTDLMGQEEPMSFFFVSKGESGLEWIDHTPMVLGPRETEKVIVVETSDNCMSSESESVRSGSEEFVENRDGINTRKRVVTVADPTQTRQVLTSADIAGDSQSVRISSPGANVELALAGDTVKSGECNPRKEAQKIISVTGESMSTGVVEGGVVYRCGECDYASTNKHYYKQHVDLVHNTARPFKCPFCDYAGKRGHALREHLIVHSAQRPYSCLHCNATFRKKGHLTNHTKLHATSSGTFCATGLPGGLLGAADTLKISAVTNSMGSFVQIPVRRNGPIITVKAEPSGRETTILVPGQKPPPHVSSAATGVTRKSKLWCAICDKEMADAASFQGEQPSMLSPGRSAQYALPRENSPVCSPQGDQPSMLSPERTPQYALPRENTPVCSRSPQRDQPSMLSPGRTPQYALPRENSPICSPQGDQPRMLSPGRTAQYALALPRENSPVCSPQGEQPSMLSPGRSAQYALPREISPVCSPQGEQPSMLSPGRTAQYALPREISPVCSPQGDQPSMLSPGRSAQYALPRKNSPACSPQGDQPSMLSPGRSAQYALPREISPVCSRSPQGEQPSMLFPGRSAQYALPREISPVCSRSPQGDHPSMLSPGRSAQYALPRKNSPAHLKTVHGTDRLFACDRCEYVTANKGAILSHLAKHIPTTSASKDPQPSAPTPPSNPLPPPPPAAPTPLYACTHCGFSTPDMSVFIYHAESHNIAVSAGTSSASAASKCTPKTSQAPSQPQISKVMCSECGHVADSTESMHAHLWTHISAAAEKHKPPPPVQQSQEQQKPVAAEPAPPLHKAEQTAAPPGAVGLKNLPENAAFKCTECSYVSRDASQFVKHMLVHKTQHNQAPRIQVHSSSSGPAAAPASTSTASTSKAASYSYKVKPISTENTCQNSESSPFVHDASRGRFRCTICGYSCEYQRTIKAHIWKHSGHQQVDYPIFQNGPLSMYEDGVSSSGPVVLQEKTGTSVQPHAPPAPIHTSVLHLAAPQPRSSVSETTNPPASAPLVNATAGGSAVTSYGPAPVKLLTLAGSQVLHSSAALPHGSVKLIPMQTKPSAADGSKHVIVHVQGAQSESQASTVRKMNVPPVSVSSEPPQKEPLTKEPQQKVISLLKRAGESEGSGLKVKREDGDTESKLQSECSVPPPAASKAVSPTEGQSAAGVAAVDSNAKTDRAIVAVSPAESGEGRTGVSVQGSVTPPTSIVSAKHTLPICATVNKQMRVAVPILSQSEKPPSLAPVPFTADSGIASSSEMYLPPSDINSTDAASNESKEPMQSTISKGSSGVPDRIPSGNADRSVSEQKDVASAEESSAEKDPDPSVDPRVPDGRSWLGTERSVVVEAVDTVLTPGSYTGLLSRQTSPRVSRSTTSSPVPAHPHQHTATHSKPGAGQVSSRILRSSTRKAHLEDSGVELEDGTCSDKTEAEHTDSSPSRKKRRESQALQDNESAATLLSLQSRDPNATISCPGRRSRNASQEGKSPAESPNRSPSSSSETESIVREAGKEEASEDLAGEVDSTSGKTRGAGGGGGICSTLLAVIEQLRERSRSESDAEDKQVAPPVKKRAGRRRGRRGWEEEESLEPRDSDHIEQLAAGDGVQFRCRLCHYTNTRLPLIRIHMRTHRQKDPFECSLCSMVTESSEALQEHMIQHCKVRTYPCKFCPQSFNHKSTQRAHMRAHSDLESFFCYVCEYETPSRQDYHAHMQKHTGNAVLCYVTSLLTDVPCVSRSTQAVLCCKHTGSAVLCCVMSLLTDVPCVSEAHGQCRAVLC